MAKLGDIATIQSGGTPARSIAEYWEDGTIPWVKISDIKSKHLNQTEEMITEAGLENSSAKIFPKENMILGGGILRSGGRTKIILVIDCLGTWCVGIPLCLLAAYGLRWGIVGVYALLNAEEAFRLVLFLVMFRRRSWMVSLSEKQSVP